MYFLFTHLSSFDERFAQARPLLLRKSCLRIETWRHRYPSYVAALAKVLEHEYSYRLVYTKSE